MSRRRATAGPPTDVLDHIHDGDDLIVPITNGVHTPTWVADESWHPANSRIPPTTAVTDVPLRPGMARPLFDR